MSGKVYVGTAKVVKFENGSEIVNAYISKTGLEVIATHTNENGGVALGIARRRNKDDFGNTHAVYINDYKNKDGK